MEVFCTPSTLSSTYSTPRSARGRERESSLLLLLSLSLWKWSASKKRRAKSIITRIKRKKPQSSLYLLLFLSFFFSHSRALYSAHSLLLFFSLSIFDAGECDRSPRDRWIIIVCRVDVFPSLKCWLRNGIYIYMYILLRIVNRSKCNNRLVYTSNLQSFHLYKYIVNGNLQRLIC